MQNFGGTNGEYYGIFESGLLQIMSGHWRKSCSQYLLVTGQQLVTIWRNIRTFQLVKVSAKSQQTVSLGKGNASYLNKS